MMLEHLNTIMQTTGLTNYFTMAMNIMKAVEVQGDCIVYK